MKLVHFLKKKIKSASRKNGVSVRDFYNRCAEREYERTIKKPHNMLEFQTTEYFYKKYLKPGMKILDAGGGPGRYTVELARAGHHMTLLDVSDKELEVAHRKIKENNVENFVDAVDLGSITKLPYDDHAFDMVLCLGGPISHLKTEDERSRAIRELVRVARPGAVICVSVMNRPAVLNLTVNNWKDYVNGYGSGYDFWKEMDLLTREGDDNWFVGCSYAHFFWPSELRELVQRSAPEVNILHLVALEWSAQNADKKFDELMADPKRARQWMNIHFALSDHPDMQGLGGHTMIVFQKPSCVK